MFELAGMQDRLGKESLPHTRYDFAGVTFPKSWCKNRQTFSTTLVDPIGNLKILVNDSEYLKDSNIS